MKTGKNQNAAITALGLAVILMLAGCQTGEEQSLEERAQARWDHLIAGEFEQAWEYYTPGFRQETDARIFDRDMRRRTIRYREARVLSSACEEDTCEVRVEVQYRVPNAPAGLSRVDGRREITETWIRTSRTWWYAPPR